MKTSQKAVRQSVSLPVKVAVQVRAMAKSRRLAERFRNEKDPEAAKRLGEEMGQMVFGR